MESHDADAFVVQQVDCIKVKYGAAVANAASGAEDDDEDKDDDESDEDAV